MGLSYRACVPNKKEDLNYLNDLDLIHFQEKINQILFISFECKCKFHVRKLLGINGGITINVDLSVKNIIYVKRLYI